MGVHEQAVDLVGGIAPPKRRDDVLSRSVSHHSGVVVAMGAGLLVMVSLGPMAAELGSVTWVLWAFVAAVGALQCLLIGEMASVFPDRSGGPAAYAHEAFKNAYPLVAAASSWGYYVAWTPGTAVNLILASYYVQATVAPGANLVVVGLALAAALYAVNYLGIELSIRTAAILAVLAITPLAVMVVGLLVTPSALRLDEVLAFSIPDRSWAAPATWALLLKWAFVAAWAAYGAEMASTVVAEIRNPEGRIPQMMMRAGVICLFTFSVVPLALIAAAGPAGLAEDPLVSLLPAAEAVFGVAGAKMLGLMLAVALVLGAHAFIIGGSRTIYQMSRDGYMPRFFGRLNKHGAPVGSIFLDALIIVALLLVFGTRVVDVVAAANFGYVFVFVILPLGYLLLGGRARGRSPMRPARRRLAIALFLFNAVLLLVGGLQWGSTVALTGVLVMSLIVPLYLLSRRQRRGSGFSSEEVPGPALAGSSLAAPEAVAP